MAKNRLSAPIQREIDRQRIIKILCSSNEFGSYFSVFSNDHHDVEEEQKKWKEDIKQLKEILEEYQEVNGDTAHSRDCSKTVFWRK